jgi:hypothetical protein
MAKKEPKDGFAQMKLGKTKPANFSNPVKVDCTLGFRQKGDCMDFELAETFQTGQTQSKVIVDELGPDGLPNGNQYLAISNDTEMTITLAPDIKWHWVEDGSAITTKKDHSKLYAVEGGFNEPIGRSITLLLKARGGQPGEPDGFSFSVELEQSKGGRLPITIDPDIRNPPPGNGFVPATAPAGGTLSVPLSAAM